jgi:hypothetical protein
VLGHGVAERITIRAHAFFGEISTFPRGDLGARSEKDERREKE